MVDLEVDPQFCKVIEEHSHIRINRESSKLIQYGFNKTFLLQDESSKYIFRLSANGKKRQAG